MMMGCHVDDDDVRKNGCCSFGRVSWLLLLLLKGGGMIISLMCGVYNISSSSSSLSSSPSWILSNDATRKGMLMMMIVIMTLLSSSSSLSPVSLRRDFFKMGRRGGVMERGGHGRVDIISFILLSSIVWG